MDDQSLYLLAEESNRESRRGTQFVGGIMAVLGIALIAGFVYATCVGWL